MAAIRGSFPPASAAGTRVEEESPSEHALPGAARGCVGARPVAIVIQLRVLGLHPSVAVVETLCLRSGILESFKQRHPAVLIGIGYVVGQGIDKKAGEVRLVALKGTLGRGDDHTIGRREHREHITAGAREIDECHALIGKTREQLCEIRRGGIGPRYADPRVGTIAAPMSDEHERHLGARGRASRHPRDGTVDVRLGGLAAESRRVVGAIFAQPDDVRVGNTKSRVHRVSESEGKLSKGTTVLWLPAQAAHDEQLCLRAQERGDEQKTPAQGYRPSGGQASIHASPRNFRYPHSAESNATSSMKFTGMSHRSISFTTVTPRLLNATSSASVPTVAGV